MCVYVPAYVCVKGEKRDSRGKEMIEQEIFQR